MIEPEAQGLLVTSLLKLCSKWRTWASLVSLVLNPSSVKFENKITVLEIIHLSDY